MVDLHDEERRVTSESGGQKGQKITRLGAIDPVALIALARVAGMGADKYSPFNYLRGYAWSLCFDAMMRHALLFWAGEDTDPESGQPHMAHAAWHALALVSFMERAVGEDDRPDVTPHVTSGDTADVTPATVTDTAATVTQDRNKSLRSVKKSEDIGYGDRRNDTPPTANNQSQLLVTSNYLRARA